MGDNVEPLAIPAQYFTPHLVAFVGRNLALEAALDSAEHDANGALNGEVGLGIKDELGLRVLR